MTTKTMPEVRPAEPTTPIKPSEAIRLGCLLAPIQAFNKLGGDDTACAMGAMYIGYGVWDGGDRGVGTLREDSPAAVAFHAVGGLPCPMACDTPVWKTGPAHLNDDHRWSRERIADWLESQGL